MHHGLYYHGATTGASWDLLLWLNTGALCDLLTWLTAGASCDCFMQLLQIHIVKYLIILNAQMLIKFMWMKLDIVTHMRVVIF